MFQAFFGFIGIPLGPSPKNIGIYFPREKGQALLLAKLRKSPASISWNFYPEKIPTYSKKQLTFIRVSFETYSRKPWKLNGKIPNPSRLYYETILGLVRTELGQSFGQVAKIPNDSRIR